MNLISNFLRILVLITYLTKLLNSAKNQETIFIFNMNTSLTIYESEGMTGLW